MQKYAPISQIVLQLVLIGLVLFLLFGRGKHALNNAREKVQDAKQGISDVQQSLDSSITKVDNSIVEFRSVLAQMKETEETLEAFKAERNELVRKLKTELAKSANERATMLAELSELKKVLDELRTQSEEFNP